MNPTAFPVSWATSADGQIIVFIARSPRKAGTLSNSLRQSVHACLRTTCVQMYHNIFTVAKRVWETITCSWISMLPHHATAFHTSHPNIWRMSSLAQGKSQRALFPFDFFFVLFCLFPSTIVDVVLFLTTHTRPAFSAHLSTRTFGSCGRVLLNSHI